MATGVVFTDAGRKVVLNRTWKSVPDYLQPSLFDVGTGTTTPALSDTALATPLSLNKAFVTGYPLLDETNLQVTTRCLVLTTEENGNSLTEFGIFNNDASKKLISRAVHTAISKTSSVQVIYVEKDMIT